MHILIVSSALKVRQRLAALYPRDCAQISWAANPEAAMELNGLRDLDLIILDAESLDRQVQRSFVMLQSEHSLEQPAIPLLVISQRPSLSELQSVLHAGASSYARWESSASVLKAACELTIAGGQYLPRDYLRALLSKAEFVAPTRHAESPSANAVLRSDVFVEPQVTEKPLPLNERHKEIAA